MKRRRLLLHTAASLRGRLVGDFLKSSIRITQHGRNFDLPAPGTISYDPVKGDVVVTNLAEGSYRIEADGTVRGLKQHLAATAYARAGTEQQVRFDPTAYHDIRGQLEIEGSCNQCLPAQMQLRRIDEESNWHVEAPVDITGTFRIRQVVDGDYVVEVAQPKSTCVEEIDLGGRPLKDQVLHLTSDSPNSSLQVRLVRTKASAAGLVDSSRVMSGKSGVVLQNVTTGAVDAEKVDGQGQFHYEGLEPGEYRVYAWRNLDLAEYRNRDYLMRYRKESNTFSISDTDTRITNLDPRMIE